MMLVLSGRSLLSACISILAGRPSNEAWDCDASPSHTALFSVSLYVQASSTSLCITTWPQVAIRLVLTIEAYRSVLRYSSLLLIVGRSVHTVSILSVVRVCTLWNRHASRSLIHLLFGCFV